MAISRCCAICTSFADFFVQIYKIVAEQDGELESRVESDWIDEEKAFDGLFAKREIEA